METSFEEHGHGEANTPFLDWEEHGDCRDKLTSGNAALNDIFPTNILEDLQKG